jgi:hypothetical protein
VSQGASRLVTDATIGAGDDGDPAALIGHIVNCPVVVACHFCLQE